MTVDTDGNMNITGDLNSTGTWIAEGGKKLTEIYLELTDSFSGDVSGTYDATVVDFTKAYAAIDDNASDIRTSIELNWTNLNTNISALNDTLGQKAYTTDIIDQTKLDEVIAGISANVTELRLNDTAQYANITSMNTTLGQKADRSEIVDGFLKNGTAASFTWVNTTDINVSNKLYGIEGINVDFSGGNFVIDLG